MSGYALRSASAPAPAAAAVSGAAPASGPAPFWRKENGRRVSPSPVRFLFPGSVVDVPVLNHRVGLIVRDDNVIEDQDADPVEEALKLKRGGDILRRGGAGAAGVVVAEED